MGLGTVMYKWQLCMVPTAIYETTRGSGARFLVKWLAGIVSRVNMAGLDSRDCPGGPKTVQWTVRGTINGVTGQAYTIALYRKMGDV